LANDCKRAIDAVVKELATHCRRSANTLLVFVEVFNPSVGRSTRYCDCSRVTRNQPIEPYEADIPIVVPEPRGTTAHAR
jgi:hypothetical protein